MKRTTLVLDEHVLEEAVDVEEVFIGLPAIEEALPGFRDERVCLRRERTVR